MTCTATRHGTPDAYAHYGCRCDLARHASMRYQKWRRIEASRGRPRTVDATTTRDQLRQLAALGWPITAVADRTHVAHSAIYHVRNGDHGRCHRNTALAVAALYEDVRDQSGPDPRAVTWAAKRGWTPPPARAAVDLDWVTVDRFLDGDRTVRLTSTERYDAWCRLLARGSSRNEAARRLGLSGRTQKVYADRLRAVGGAA